MISIHIPDGVEQWTAEQFVPLVEAYRLSYCHSATDPQDPDLHALIRSQSRKV